MKQISRASGEEHGRDDEVLAFLVCRRRHRAEGCWGGQSTRDEGFVDVWVGTQGKA